MAVFNKGLPTFKPAPSSSKPLGLGGGISPSVKADKKPTKWTAPIQGLGGGVNATGLNQSPTEWGTPLGTANRALAVANAYTDPIGVQGGGPTVAQTHTPSQSELEWLNAKNWETPEVEQSTSSAEKFLKSAKTTELTPYDYTLTPAQADALEARYATREGYRPPAAGDDGADPDIVVDDVKQAELTWKQYNKLSDDQKLAVDFNTLLVEAREKDLETRTFIPWKAETMNDYNEKVTQIFGPQGVSRTTAFNVVDLLDSIDMKVVGQDLDEYLSLDRAIDADELKEFNLSKLTPKQAEETTYTSALQVGTDPSGNPTMQVVSTPDLTNLRSDSNLAAIDSAAIEKAGEQIRKMMADPNRKAWDPVSAMTPSKNLNPKDVPWGYGRVDPKVEDSAGKDAWYAGSWNLLRDARATNALDLLGQEFINREFTKADLDEWYNWVYNRAKQESQYGGRPLIDQETAQTVDKVRSPDEILKLLGLED